MLTANLRPAMVSVLLLQPALECVCESPAAPEGPGGVGLKNAKATECIKRLARWERSISEEFFVAKMIALFEFRNDQRKECPSTARW